MGGFEVALASKVLSEPIRLGVSLHSSVPLFYRRAAVGGLQKEQERERKPDEQEREDPKSERLSQNKTGGQQIYI